MLHIVRSEKTATGTAANANLGVSFAAGKGVGAGGTVPKQGGLLSGVQFQISNGAVVTAAHMDDVVELLEDGYLTVLIDGIEVVKGPVANFPAGGPFSAGETAATDRQNIAVNGQMPLPLPHKIEVQQNQVIKAVLDHPAVDAAVSFYVNLAFEV